MDFLLTFIHVLGTGLGGFTFVAVYSYPLGEEQVL